MDTKNTKEVIKLVVDGVKLGAQVKKDGGKPSAEDVPLAFKVLQDLPAAISDISLVDDEVLDIDASEKADLVAYAMSELALEEGHAKEVVEAALDTLASAARLAAVIAKKPAASA